MAPGSATDYLSRAHASWVHCFGSAHQLRRPHQQQKAKPEPPLPFNYFSNSTRVRRRRTPRAGSLPPTSYSPPDRSTVNVLRLDGAIFPAT